MIGPSFVFPSILPTGTIDTPLRFHADVFATVLALDLWLHNPAVGDPLVSLGDHEEAESNENEAHDLVEKAAVCPDNSSITKSLLDGVVAGDATVIVLLAFSQNDETFVQVAGEEGQ